MNGRMRSGSIQKLGVVLILPMLAAFSLFAILLRGPSTVWAAPTPEALVAPAGFRVNLYASDLGPARFMAVGPAGEIYVTTRQNGSVIRLRDSNGDGVADESSVFAGGFERPHGIAIHDGWVYVGETGRITRVTDTDQDGVADNREVVVPDLPAGGGHFTRTVDFGPDGKMYVTVGSSCNVCIETDPRRASMLQYNQDGSDGRIYASGLRNSVGFAFQPTTGVIWATDNGRDLLGDEFPPEEINVIRDGANYGWPRCHGDREPDPQFGDAGLCATTEPPAFKMQAHSAPLGLSFYDGADFPPDYLGDVFVAFHGSWNRSEPTGYKVVRVHVSNGQPISIEDFLTGFTAGGKAWGRPVQPIVGPDGALYVSDDEAGAIYRVSYSANR
jgi:glucose/arabinose dehydrogenase